VGSLREVLERLHDEGLYETLVRKVADTHAVIHDPDGRSVVLTERD